MRHSPRRLFFEFRVAGVELDAAARSKSLVSAIRLTDTEELPSPVMPLTLHTPGGHFFFFFFQCKHSAHLPQDLVLLGRPPGCLVGGPGGGMSVFGAGSLVGFASNEMNDTSPGSPIEATATGGGTVVHLGGESEGSMATCLGGSYRTFCQNCGQKKYFSEN
jgi:hypothetical protein